MLYAPDAMRWHPAVEGISVLAVVRFIEAWFLRWEVPVPPSCVTIPNVDQRPLCCVCVTAAALVLSASWHFYAGRRRASHHRGTTVGSGQRRAAVPTDLEPRVGRMPGLSAIVAADVRLDSAGSDSRIDSHRSDVRQYRRDESPFRLRTETGRRLDCQPSHKALASRR